MNTIKDIITFLVSAGTAPQGNVSQRQDGSTATLVMLLFLLALIFIFVEIMYGPSGTFAYPDIQFSVLALFILSGFLACIVIGVMIYKRGLNALADEKPKITRIKEFFMWLFGIPSMVSCTLRVVNMIDCSFSDQNARDTSKSELFYYVTTVMFTLAEMVFLSYCSHYKFKTSLLSNYTLSLLVIGNLSIWYPSSVFDHKIYPKTNETVANSENCMANSTISHLIRKLHPFVAPIFLEYLLLSITLAKEILFKDERPIVKEPANYLVMRSLSEEEDFVAISDNENMPLNTSAVPRSWRSDGRNVRRERMNERIPVAFYLSLVMFFLSGSICFIGYLLQVSLGEVVNSRIMLITHIAALCYKVFMLCLVAYGLMYLVKETLRNSNYNPHLTGEYIVVFTALTVFIMHIMGFCAATITANAVNIVGSSVDIVQDYLQLIFLLHSNRYVRHTLGNPRKHMKWITWLLSAANLGCWINDSFFLFQFPFTQVNLSYFERTLRDNRLLSDIIIPMSVYYRFVCGYMFYAISKRFS